jgi:hypothetical protein
VCHFTTSLIKGRPIAGLLLGATVAPVRFDAEVGSSSVRALANDHDGRDDFENQVFHVGPPL